MEKLRKLYELESDKEVAQKIKYALYLYKDLLSDDNNELLDDYTNTLIEIFESKSADGYNRNFANYIQEKFYHFLIKNGKTEKTAYDYVKRIERICEEYQINIEDLFNRRTAYSINDLIGMYSPNGIKSDENKAKHNAPLSSLKQFRDFMENKKTDVDNTPFYLCDNEGFQSWEIMSKHPFIIEINGKKCEITFKENRVVCDKTSKIINDDNYYELINVFRKYKAILSNDTTPIFQNFPYGGVHSFKYQFEEKSNFSGCASLFQSDNRKLVEQAYKEYHVIIEKIIKQ